MAQGSGKNQCSKGINTSSTFTAKYLVGNKKYSITHTCGEIVDVVVERARKIATDFARRNAPDFIKGRNFKVKVSI